MDTQCERMPDEEDTATLMGLLDMVETYLSIRFPPVCVAEALRMMGSFGRLHYNLYKRQHMQIAVHSIYNGWFPETIDIHIFTPFFADRCDRCSYATILDYYYNWYHYRRGSVDELTESFSRLSAEDDIENITYAITNLGMC